MFDRIINLEVDRYPMWHYRRYGVEALVALGRKAEAIQYAEASRGLNQADSVIDRACEDILISSGLHEGKWFATAKDLKFFKLALELANQSPCDPKTLTRAARDYIDKEPGFALGSALAALRWLCEGWGYEVTNFDVIEAYDYAMDAAAVLGNTDDVKAHILQLIELGDSGSSQFIRQSLRRRLGST